MNEEQDKQEIERHYKEETGGQCGRCGCKLTYGNDMGDGFCRDCHQEDDRL